MKSCRGNSHACAALCGVLEAHSLRVGTGSASTHPIPGLQRLALLPGATASRVRAPIRRVRSGAMGPPREGWRSAGTTAAPERPPGMFSGARPNEETRRTVGSLRHASLCPERLMPVLRSLGLIPTKSERRNGRRGRRQARGSGARCEPDEKRRGRAFPTEGAGVPLRWRRGGRPSRLSSESLENRLVKYAQQRRKHQIVSPAVSPLQGATPDGMPCPAGRVCRADWVSPEGKGQEGTRDRDKCLCSSSVYFKAVAAQTRRIEKFKTGVRCKKPSRINIESTDLTLFF